MSETAAPETLQVQGEGMSCASCASRIETTLRKLPGAEEASANFASEQATLAFDPKRSRRARREGARAPRLGDHTEQTTLALEGMTCASCAARIERALARVHG